MVEQATPVIREFMYKQIKVVITSRQLPGGRWQSAVSGGGYDATLDPADSLAASQSSAKLIAELMLGRWLG